MPRKGKGTEGPPFHYCCQSARLGNMLAGRLSWRDEARAEARKEKVEQNAPKGMLPSSSTRCCLMHATTRNTQRIRFRVGFARFIESFFTSFSSSSFCTVERQKSSKQSPVMRWVCGRFSSSALVSCIPQASPRPCYALVPRRKRFVTPG